MTQMPPDQQLRDLLARHDRLLADTAQQNHELHEWAVRYGPRPAASAGTPAVSPFFAQPSAFPPPAFPPPAFPPPVVAAPRTGVRPPEFVPPQPAEAAPAPSGPDAGSPPDLPARPTLSTTQVVARVLAGIGALVTLVGVAFILVLAAQYGYFGPAPRTISAAMLGVVLAGGAFLLHRRDPDNAGGPALLATGMAAGFLSLVAGTTLYHLVPGVVGLVLAGLLGIAVSLVAALWRSEWLACLAVAAALVIGPSVSGDVHLGAAFMVVLSAVASVAHLRMRWPAFHVARTLPTTFLLVGLAGTYGLSDKDAWLLVALSGVHAVMGALSALLGRRTATAEQWALASVLVAPALPVLLLAMSRLPRLEGAWVVLGAAVLYVVVALFRGGRDWLRATGVALAGVFALTTVGLATHLSLVDVLAPGLAVAYAAAAGSLRSRAVGIVALVGSLVGLAGWVPVGVPAAFGIRFRDVLVGSLLVVLLAAVGHWATRRVLAHPSPGWLRYALIAVGMLGGAAVVTSAGSLLARTSGAPIAIHQTSSVVVTVGWALASVVVLRQPLRSSDHAGGWIRLGLGLAAAATGKLFLVDLALLPGLARGVAFLLVGLLLLALGISYAKAYERARIPVQPAES
jgi:hypothetical protein